MGENLNTELGELVVGQLQAILENARKYRDLAGDGTYQAFLHGQASGLVLALKIIFPGEGKLGEQAANLARAVLGENECGCRHHGMDEVSSGE